MQELKAMEEDMLRIRQKLVDRLEILEKGKTDV